MHSVEAAKLLLHSANKHPMCALAVVDGIVHPPESNVLEGGNNMMAKVDQSHVCLTTLDLGEMTKTVQDMLDSNSCSAPATISNSTVGAIGKSKRFS